MDAIDFNLVSDFQPSGDQPEAIKALLAGLEQQKKKQVLLGVTGSGKTFTIANVIEKYKRPTLVMCHNKTLAAQLFNEFRTFFPHNAVEYFVSYYDYYQPEAYIPQRDIYIEKDSSINENIDRLRLSATCSLLSRSDVIIVSSVSCIYGLGSPKEYLDSAFEVRCGEELNRDLLMLKLIDMQYERNDVDFSRGKIRVRGDVVELIPAYAKHGIRLDFFGDELERIMTFNPISGEVLQELERMMIFPAKHYMLGEARLAAGLEAIHAEVRTQVTKFADEGKLVEAQRLNARTAYDLEMIEEVGYCSGIENYSRHMEGRAAGERPSCLLDYFPDDFLLVIDESHVSVPQIRGMHAGDKSRKTTLVEHGFRLPSALDNRPMIFDEFEEASDKVIYVSATPGPYELEETHGEVVEQLIRPTGLVDPVIRIEPAGEQVKHLIEEVKLRVDLGERTLVTTLTKRFSEDLAFYIQQEGIKVNYLHSEINTIERVEILKDLRKGKYDVLVGVNLLREGLDLPEVSLVAILDADKEGFLRSATSLVQTIGRAARHINAQVILYADKITKSMQFAIDETQRRREFQMAFNKEHGITPTSIKREINDTLQDLLDASSVEQAVFDMDIDKLQLVEKIAKMEEEMFQAAEDLEFELAAKLRDAIEALTTKQSTANNKGSKKKRKKR